MQLRVSESCAVYINGKDCKIVCASLILSGGYMTGKKKGKRDIRCEERLIKPSSEM